MAAFTLPPLPFAPSALVPHISQETIEFHYGKHHRGYVNKLNAVAKNDSKIASSSLETLIMTQEGKVFNLAAQIWNHTFYWETLSPNGGGAPTGRLLELIQRDFSCFGNFKTKFTAEAASHFGSGWVWLVLNSSGKLEILSTHDAANPMRDGKTPILTLDVWEHAYYIDYRNGRGDYIKAFWNLVNWKHAEKQM